MGASYTSYTSCSAPSVSKSCECEVGKAAATVKPRLRVGCAVGIASAPVQLALLHNSNVDDLSCAVHWVKCPPDADAVLAMLTAGLIDLAVLHTEDAVQTLASGSSLRVCGTFTSSQRRWGLYTSSCHRDFETLGQSASSPVGVPSNCLGAQLGLHLLGEHCQWSGVGGVYLRQISSLETADVALTSGKVQALLWERHAAHDLVTSGKWVDSWEASLPWASTIFLCNKEASYSKANCIKGFVAWCRQAASDFLQAKSAEPALKLLSSNFKIRDGAVLDWLNTVTWKCQCEVEEADLSAAFELLHRSGRVAESCSFDPVQWVARSICDIVEAVQDRDEMGGVTVFALDDGLVAEEFDDGTLTDGLQKRAEADAKEATQGRPVPAG
eukprot:TRINITY_DN19189_c0_g1_i1.p1 TRINITY_DN19189_c0_g1~~TRINITY_DN19189_c0_g1_i1.p1  ORF type:complete len:384 (-),score=86.86 TRINITY_DN19189_c0_g1_i1:18-1169(-)